MTKMNTMKTKKKFKVMNSRSGPQSAVFSFQGTLVGHVLHLVLFVVCLSVFSCSQSERGVVFRLKVDTGSPEEIYIGQSIDDLIASGIIEEQDYSDEYICSIQGYSTQRDVLVGASDDDNLVNSVTVVFDSDHDCHVGQRIAQDLFKDLVAQYGEDYRIAESRILPRGDKTLSVSTRPRIVWLHQSSVVIELAYSPCSLIDSFANVGLYPRTDVLLQYAVLEVDSDSPNAKIEESEYWTRESLGLSR